MQDTDLLVRKLAETRETLRQLLARFGESPAMLVPIARLREQEAKLLDQIQAVGSRQ